MQPALEYGMRREHSAFSDGMNLSITATLPCLPTAPYRGREIADSIRGEVQAFSGDQQFRDDLTLLVVKYLGVGG